MQRFQCSGNSGYSISHPFTKPGTSKDMRELTCSTINNACPTNIKINPGIIWQIVSHSQMKILAIFFKTPKRYPGTTD